jgi:PLD-like domain
MRYIDTGSRDPNHALGFWLDEHIYRDLTVRELRWQTAFFDAACLPFFEPLMAKLEAAGGVLNVLVGSNDGITSQSDVEALLLAAGAPRPERRIGIVSFRNGYFHPKTVHIVRADGSSAAYVGSANLTKNGTCSHIEAGLLVDTRENDDAAVLSEIASAIDRWFLAPSNGVTVVQTAADLASLTQGGVLNVPRPPQARPQLGARLRSPTHLARLYSLVDIPEQQNPSPPRPAPATAAPPAPPAPPTGTPQSAPQPLTPEVQAPDTPQAAADERWWKRLTVSDAQRKGAGHQRGSITLTQGARSINAQRYFRYELFKSAHWRPGHARTGVQREVATIPFQVQSLGDDRGILEFEVSYAPNREASQANYTSLLHLGPLSAYFHAYNMTGNWLELARLADGTYTLSITDERPV